MNRLSYSTVVLAVAAAALVVPATLFAQGDPAPRGGAGTNLPGGGGGGGAAGGGAAVSRPEASGGGTPSSGSSGGSTGGSTWNGGGGSPGSYGGGWTNPDTRRAAALENARRRSDAREDNGGRRYGAGADAGTSGDAVNRSVPWYSRSREGRPIVGTAAGREEVGRPGRPNGGGGYSPGYDYYDRMGYGYIAGYNSLECRAYGFGAYGMGYFFYDPSWWSGTGYFPNCRGSYYSPGGYYGYGYGGYGGGYWGGTTYWPDYGGGGGGSYSGESSPGTNASLKLKVKPNNAQVFIDGYFAGSVDDFDGMFQKLPVRPGEHRLEFRAPGYEALVTDVRVDPYEIFSVKAELKRK